MGIQHFWSCLIILRINHLTFYLFWNTLLWIDFRYQPGRVCSEMSLISWCSFWHHGISLKHSGMQCSYISYIISIANWYQEFWSCLIILRIIWFFLSILEYLTHFLLYFHPFLDAVIGTMEYLWSIQACNDHTSLHTVQT